MAEVIMEKKQLTTLSVPDADLKLTRAASCSELTATKRMLLEQQRFQDEQSDPLRRQHSSEHIFDLKQNIRLIKISKLAESTKAKKTPVDIFSWKIPFSVSNSSLALPSNMNFLTKPFQDSAQDKKIDRMEERDLLKMPSFKNPEFNKTLERSKSQGYLFGAQPVRELHEDVQRLSIHRPKARKPLTLSKLMMKDEFYPGLKNLREQPLATHSAPATPVSSTLAIQAPEATRHQKSKTPKKANKEPVDSEMTAHTTWFWPALFFSLLPVALIFLSAAFNQEDLVNQFCSPAMNFSTSIQELRRRVYGQEQAVNQLSRFLENRHRQSGFLVLALVGGTGVGKSYTANVLRENMAGKHLALEYFPPLSEKVIDAYETLYTCGCSLLILDNLKNKHLDESAEFCHDLKKRATNYCVLVLAIFNTQKISDSLKKDIDLNDSAEVIAASFNEKKIDVEVVRYENLEDQALEKCILEVEENLGVKLSAKNRDYILRGLHLAQSGCKGAYSKVQLFAKQSD